MCVCANRYEAAVKKADTSRCEIEALVGDFVTYVPSSACFLTAFSFSRFEEQELNRLRWQKSVISDLSAYFSSLVPVLSTGPGRVNLVLETLDPVRAVSLISERDRTGSQRSVRMNLCSNT